MSWGLTDHVWLEVHGQDHTVVYYKVNFKLQCQMRLLAVPRYVSKSSF